MQRNFLSTVCYALLVFVTISSAMGDEHHDHSSPATVTEQTVHASGTVKSIADNHESVRIFHDPIPVLKWPSMNMQFEVIDHDLTHPLEVGDRVNFEFVQKEGKNIIVKINK
ncbi:MAG: copper-binding protein [Sulfuricurvum sp.]|nr:copper-binding protein [Sulfuricurvum sp.]